MYIVPNRTAQTPATGLRDHAYIASVRRTPSASINGTVASVVTNVMTTNIVKSGGREDAELAADVERDELDQPRVLSSDANRQRVAPRRIRSSAPPARCRRACRPLAQPMIASVISHAVLPGTSAISVVRPISTKNAGSSSDADASERRFEALEHVGMPRHAGAGQERAEHRVNADALG